jgi:hypothetical protein
VVNVNEVSAAVSGVYPAGRAHLWLRDCQRLRGAGRGAH